MDFEWKSWEGWSSCSKTCGGEGKIKRIRNCTPPKFGGKECPSKTQTETKKCGTKDSCPGR